MGTVQISSTVRVDEEVCRRLADFLSTRDIPEDREDSALPGFSQQHIGNFYFLLVAICHQTSPRGRAPLEGLVAGSRRRGWDYLFARLEEGSRKDQSLLRPERWKELRADELRELLRDPSLGDRLSNPEVRAELLRDLGAKMLAHGWSWADQIYDHCRGRVASGTPNLLECLAEFRAYSDPVRKKSVFFLALMRNSGLWKYRDNHLLGAPVDYHEVRGHLRLGTVRVDDPQLIEKLRAEEAVTPEEDVAIRQAVYDAIMHVSDWSGLKNPSQVHYLFWNLFRSICTRVEPQCFALREDCSLPNRYIHLTESESGRRCPFALFCASAGNSHPVCEHVFETDYY